MDRYTFTLRYKGKEQAFLIRANSLDEAVGIKNQMALARYDGKTPGAIPWLSHIKFLRRK